VVQAWAKASVAQTKAFGQDVEKAMGKGMLVDHCADKVLF
jgi:hypothetical protein